MEVGESKAGLDSRVVSRIVRSLVGDVSKVC